MQPQLSTLPAIRAEPRVALFDERINIELSNFPRNERITLHAQRVHGQKKIVYASCGHYMTDECGQVRVAEQPSTGGTYTGTEPMGVLWSLRPAHGQPHISPLWKRSIDRPVFIHLKTYRGHLQLEDIYESKAGLESLADIELERWGRFPSQVTCLEVRSGKIRGTLCLPHGGGPFQGIIDMFGSGGDNPDFRAALLASRGFAALSLAYFKYQDLPTDLSDVNLDYFEEAVDWLSSHPMVYPHGIGVLGISKGAEFACCMGAYLEKVTCVVSVCGNSYLTRDDFYHKGKLLIKASEFEVDKCGISKDGECIMAPAMPFKNNLIPAWQGDAKYLLFVAEDDPTVIKDNYKLLLESCPEEKKSNFEVVSYPGAGHLLVMPFAPLIRSTINPTLGVMVLYGGQWKEHAHAQEDAWQRLLQYFQRNIPTSPISSS